MPKKQRYLCVFWVIYNFHSRKWSLVYMCRSFTFLKRMVFVRWFNHCFLVHSFFGFAPWLSSCSPQWGCASNKPLQRHTWCRPKDTRPQGPRAPGGMPISSRKISGKSQGSEILCNLHQLSQLSQLLFGWSPVHWISMDFSVEKSRVLMDFRYCQTLPTFWASPEPGHPEVPKMLGSTQETNPGAI